MVVVAACSKDPVTVAFDRDPPQVGSLVGKIVTTNGGDDTLSVVDPDPAVHTIGTLPIGLNPVDLEGPHHVSADPGGRFLYVNLSMAVAGAGSGPHGAHGRGDQPGHVLKLDTSDGRTIGRVAVDPNPGDNTLSADGRRLYVTHYDELRWRGPAPDGGTAARDSDLVVVDTESMTIAARVPLCPAAHGVRLDAAEATLYATCGPDELAVVDLRAKPASVRRVALPRGQTGGTTCQRCPYALSVAPDGSVWVSSLGPSGGAQGGGGIDVYDPTTGAFDAARSRVMQGRAMFAAFSGSPAAYRAYVPEQGRGLDLSGAIVMFDVTGATTTAAGSLPLDPAVCYQPHMMLVAADGARGHLICEGDHLPREREGKGGDFLWLDLSRRTVLRAAHIGVFADGMAWVPQPGGRDAGP